MLDSPTESNSKFVCPKCGSDDVTVDATARWDIKAQDWVISSTFDDMTCSACGHESPEFRKVSADQPHVTPEGLLAAISDLLQGHNILNDSNEALTYVSFVNPAGDTLAVGFANGQRYELRITASETPILLQETSLQQYNATVHRTFSFDVTVEAGSKAAATDKALQLIRSQDQPLDSYTTDTITLAALSLAQADD